MGKKIKILIVDDAMLVRAVLSRELKKVEEFDVVGAVADAYAARDFIAGNKPDVILLDIEMPKMDGITFLTKMMKSVPIPTIIVSSVAARGSKIALEAMLNGAIDVVPKPREGNALDEILPLLIQKIKTAATINAENILAKSQLPTLPKNAPFTATTNKILVIGSSTGGTVALEKILPSLPANCPPVIIVQHIPEGFSRTLAERLNTMCEVSVKEAKDGDAVVSGQVLIAPGNKHLWLKKTGSRYEVKVATGVPVHYQRPCVEHLFDSAAECAGKSVVAVLLTGMGSDGAAGMLNLKNAGARTIAQDENTSVVWGMPGSAVKLGAAEFVLPLNKIIPKALELLR